MKMGKCSVKMCLSYFAVDTYYLWTTQTLNFFENLVTSRQLNNHTEFLELFRLDFQRCANNASTDNENM
jgi:hypothetical protein